MRPGAGAVRRWARELAELLLPAGCVVCGAWLPRPRDGRLTCGPCRSRLPAAPWPRCPRCHLPRGTGRMEATLCRGCREWPAVLTRARWAWIMEPPADALVHALKYEGWAGLAAEMGEAMAAALGRVEGPAPAFVTPVPTTRDRLGARGYNQARLLAEAVSGAVGIPLVETLERTRGGSTQVALSPSLRWANVEGVFRAAIPCGTRLSGTHAVLVDDVLTTGATAARAASVLGAAGVAEITVLTFARALPERRTTPP